jgi:hypothetical protein
VKTHPLPGRSRRRSSSPVSFMALTQTDKAEAQPRAIASALNERLQQRFCLPRGKAAALVFDFDENACRRRGRAKRYRRTAAGELEGVLEQVGDRRSENLPVCLHATECSTGRTAKSRPRDRATMDAPSPRSKRSTAWRLALSLSSVWSATSSEVARSNASRSCSPKKGSPRVSSVSVTAGAFLAATRCRARDRIASRFVSTKSRSTPRG